ncbi:S-layer homology domain-containing protein [Aminipila terrae]|uniref:SLH domain-containing protein n=1 Tax=Aminipila terrae TaxID=2697030 RepID=A0A6P1MM05_9FIRM|nr:S-layer homology domain-containing protein [Aminipila terrae]QHI72676.1 hypothetical protein Ami3637_09945 [Aminipila terrae]
MKKTLIYFFTVVALIISTTVIAFGANYYDLNGTAYQKYASELSNRGIISGYPDGQFKPNNNITRAEFATMVAKMDGVNNTAQYNSSFNDMEGYSWAKGYIGYCASKGILKGDGKGNVMPAQNITLGEAVTMVVRALGYEKDIQTGYAWPQNYINVATKYSLLNNVPSYLNDTVLTRGDVSIMLYNSVSPSNTVIANNEVNVNSNNNITINDNSVTDNSVKTNITINITEPKINSDTKNISTLEADKEKLQEYINECNLNKQKLQIKLDQYEDKLKEAKANLEAVKQQKTVRVYHADQGWVYEADQNAVKKCEEQVTYYEGYVKQYQLLIEEWNSKIASAEKKIAQLEKQIDELKGNTNNNQPNKDSDKPSKVIKGYGVINEKNTGSNNDGDKVFYVVGYMDGKELDALTDDQSSFNSWKVPTKSGDNWYLYEIGVNSKNVIVSTDKISADINKETIKDADNRLSVVIPSGKRYALSSKATIYQVTDDGYSVYSGKLKAGDCISLYETDSSEDGYDIVIFSRP